MNAQQILAVPPTDYARLFPAADTIRAVYHDLLFAWHPDRQPDPQAAAVTAHLKMLHDEACKARDAGNWTEPNTLRLQADGRQFVFRFQRKVATPAGNLHVGLARLAVVSDAGMDDLVRHARKVAAGLPPLPRAMTSEFLPLLPGTYQPTQSAGREGYTFKMDPRAVRVRDLLDKTGGLDTVAALVDDLTDPSTKSDGNRQVRRAIDRAHSAKASPAAKTVKLADIIDNTTSIVRHDRSFARLYRSEIEMLLPLLAEGDTSLHARASAQVASAMENCR
ncbi:hypothetical protein [Azorhizobium doebereinerae]|uniref:hypothetical protein n=1 Tax=Azorhizobium doebereinerae TaxID=281091 RepID=UPI0004021E15|nr:hypothetical protein [Azorhizobium doebereinerae]